MASGTSKKQSTPGGALSTYPWWAPRFWHGMTFGVWIGLLWRNRFRVSPSRIPMAFAITAVSLFNSALACLQWLVLSRKVQRSAPLQPPIFIIGHWRSGTTYLHELMVLDNRLAFPTTYECLSPSHFLVSGWFITRWMKFLLPRKRPMDNMSAGWDLPQEDEFALCNLGLGSPYTTMAFPNRPPQDQEYLDLTNLPAPAVQRWKDGMHWFLRHVAYAKPGKPIVLKSPPHTARIKVLLELFPDAKFVHIVRNPLSVFPSTVRLWRSLYEVNGLQVDDGHDLTEEIFDSFDRMYRDFDEQFGKIPSNRAFEVRYEDLVQNPVEQLQALYERFELADFEVARAAIEAAVQSSKNYRTNRFNVPDETQALILDRLGPFIQRYGYAESFVAVPTVGTPAS
ncbi:MAG: sulfotransferase [Planctomycetota bacterium]|nr:sulfotransferase [Planctomycetota bacterium]